MADLPVPEIPRLPPRPDGGLSERVADADRDRTVTLLREHVVEGRLTLDEFSERVGRALQARTRGTSTPSWPTCRPRRRGRRPPNSLPAGDADGTWRS